MIIPLPTLSSTPPPLSSGQIRALQAEIRALAEERDALILAHNYQAPEIQQVAHLSGDSLQLARWAAACPQEIIALCGVHFMAETAAILNPEKRVLLPDLEAGCSLADSINPAQLRAWQRAHPGALTVMYVNTSAGVKALTDVCCTSSNAVEVVSSLLGEHGWGQEILFGPDMWLGEYVRRRLGSPPGLRVWDGECHVHAGIRPSDINRARAQRPEAEFLIHPECGCSTQAMEFLASGDIDSEKVHLLSTGQMLEHVRARPEGEFIVATETGMLYGLEQAAPHARLIPANQRAVCSYMKKITLPKLRDCLRSGEPQVRVEEELASAARRSIQRMVEIG